MARKCEHRKQGRMKGERYWRCLDCGARIDGVMLAGAPHKTTGPHTDA